VLCDAYVPPLVSSRARIDRNRSPCIVLHCSNACVCRPATRWLIPGRTWPLTSAITAQPARRS
jgi:hypothetical protein